MNREAFTDDDIITALETLLAETEECRLDVAVTLGNIGHDAKAMRRALNSGEEPMLPLVVPEDWKAKKLLKHLSLIYWNAVQALECLEPAKPKPAVNGTAKQPEKRT